MGEAAWEVRASGQGMSKSQGCHRIQRRESGQWYGKSVVWCQVGSTLGGVGVGDSITYRFADSLCCMPETNVTSCVNYISTNKQTNSHAIRLSVSDVYPRGARGAVRTKGKKLNVLSNWGTDPRGQPVNYWPGGCC